MDQPTLINRNNIKISSETETARLAKSYAVDAMEEARSQVVQDMEDMRLNVKRLMDHISMKKLMENLFNVAKEGANNMKKHMTNENTQRMVLEIAKQMDALLHQEIGRRFVHGSEIVTSPNPEYITQLITAGTKAYGSFDREMGETLTEFVSVLLTGMIDATKGNWEMFKIWWNLYNQFDEATNKGLAMYDDLIQKSTYATPDTTSKYRKELENIISDMQKDYGACYSDMGLKLFANSMMITCVTSAGTCLALGAAGIIVGGASCDVVRNEAARFLEQLGKGFAIVAIIATSLTLIAAGIYYIFGKKDQPEKIVERWQRYLRKSD